MVEHAVGDEMREVAVMHREMIKAVGGDVGPRERRQFAILLDSHTGNPRHPRGEAQQGRATAGAGLQHALASFGWHTGGEQHRLDAAAMAVGTLAMDHLATHQRIRRSAHTISPASRRTRSA